MTSTTIFYFLTGGGGLGAYCGVQIFCPSQIFWGPASRKGMIDSLGFPSKLLGYFGVGDGKKFIFWPFFGLKNGQN